MSIYGKLFEVKKAGITLVRDTKRFNYKYATLDQIQSKLGEVLQAQGLVVVHFIKDNKVVTEIREKEGTEFISSEIEIVTSKPQDKGSEITYYRRYNLLSLLDLEVEDDDGKTAQDSKSETKAEVKPNWYNDVDKNLDKWTDMVADGKTTAESIISQIEAKGFTISKVNKEKILKLTK